MADTQGVDTKEAPKNRKEEAAKHGVRPEHQMPEHQMPSVVQPMMDAGTPAALERSVGMAERYFELLERIRRAAVKATNHRDWIDQEGTPYLEFTGASKVANAFGVLITDREHERQEYEDDRGQYYIFIERAVAHWNNRIQPEMGTCSTRDPFFAQRTRNGKKILLPLSEIDLPSIMKKAHTNLLNRAIKGLLGLSFSWEELEEISGGKISREKCTGVPRDKGAQGGNTDTPDAAKMRSDIRRKVATMADKDEKVYGDILAECSKWKKRDGEEVAGKRSLSDISEAALKHVQRAVNLKYDKWSSDRKGGANATA